MIDLIDKLPTPICGCGFDISRCAGGWKIWTRRDSGPSPDPSGVSEGRNRRRLKYSLFYWRLDQTFLKQHQDVQSGVYRV